MRKRHCRAEGGVPIAYRVVGGRKGARDMVLAGGLGGTHLVWTGLARALRDRYRIVIWDYPGLSAGDPPLGDTPVDIPSLAGYQAAVLDAEGLPGAIFGGWSLGVQVILEMARSRSDRILGMVALSGVAGRPFVADDGDEPISAAIGLRASIPGALEWISERMDRIERLRSMLGRIEHPARWAKRLGLVDPLADELVLDAVIRDFLAIDADNYRSYVRASAEHDASDLLDRLPFPVLAIAGERDRLVRPGRVEEMAAALPDARFVSVRGATHFLPLEYPEVVALAIDDFVGPGADL